MDYLSSYSTSFLVVTKASEHVTPQPQDVSDPDDPGRGFGEGQEFWRGSYIYRDPVTAIERLVAGHRV